jgi:hypothetical protein
MNMEDSSFFDSGSNEATEHFVSTGAGTSSAQGLSANFDKEMWETIEKKLSSHEIEVLKVLVDYAFGVDSRISHPIYSISDKYYRQYRSSLTVALRRNKTSPVIPMSLVLGDEIPIAAPQAELAGGKGKKAPKPKPLSKAEEIKQKNSVGRIKQSIDDALSTFKSSYINFFDCFNEF